MSFQILTGAQIIVQNNATLSLLCASNVISFQPNSVFIFSDPESGNPDLQFTFTGTPLSASELLTFISTPSTPSFIDSLATCISVPPNVTTATTVEKHAVDNGSNRKMKMKKKQKQKQQKNEKKGSVVDYGVESSRGGGCCGSRRKTKRKRKKEEILIFSLLKCLINILQGIH